MLELVFRYREECWLDGLDRLGLPCGRGFQVQDGHDQTSRTMYLSIGIIGPEDSRGLPIQLNMKKAPATIGGCPLCSVVGCPSGISFTIYACAVAYTAGDSVMRDRLRAEFGNPLKSKRTKRMKSLQTHVAYASKVCEYMKARSEQERPPPLWTTKEALASSSRMDNGGKKKLEPFRAGKDAYSALFGPQFDKMAAALIDLAHEFANLLSHLLSIVAGVKKGPGSMNKKRLAFEKLLGRGHRFAKIGKGRKRRFPFQGSKSVGNTLERFLRECCRLPRGSAAMRRPFSNPGSMKLVR